MTLRERAAFAGDLDSLGVLSQVERLGEQCREGWRIGLAASGLPDADGVDSVVVLGMGGSAAAGDVVAAVVDPRLVLPFRVVKGYPPLPEWIGRNTLVLAVSYSGNTEETLASVGNAHERGARIVAVCSGGALETFASDHGSARVAIPGGFQPRAALGYLVMALLAVLVRVGLIPDFGDDVGECAEILDDLGRRCGSDSPVADNPAKDLAARLAGRIPIFYGGQGIGAVAARRFKTDVNEYAKTPAFYNVLPEVDHNELEGWAGAPGTEGEFVLVLLRQLDDHPRVALRFDATRSLIEEHFSEVVEVRSEERSALARLMSLAMLGSLTAIYIALASGIDPGPVDAMQRLKDELAEQ